MKRRCFIKWIAISIALLALTVLIDLIAFNSGVFFIPDQYKGVYSVHPEMKKETNDDGTITTTMVLRPDSFIQKINVILPDSSSTDFLPYEVYVKKEDGNFYLNSTEYLPPEANAIDTVSLRVRAEEIHFIFKADIKLICFSVDNSIKLNSRRILVWFAGVLCAYLLYALKSHVAKRLELGFVIIAMTIGLAFAVAMPSAVGVMYDDQIHWERSVNLAISNPEQEMLDLTTIRWGYINNGNYMHPFNTAEDQYRYHISINQNTPTKQQVSRTEALTDIGYAAQSLGLWFARAIGLPLHWQFVAGRLGNLLLYVVVCYFAIKLAVRYKALFMVLALGPMSLFSAGAYSYDPTVISCCLLGLSLFFGELLTPHKPLQRSRAVIMLAAFAIGSLPKAVYGVMIALPLILPGSKFETKRQCLWFKFMTVLLLLLVVASFVLPTLMGDQSHSDPRGGETSVPDQLSLIFSHPLTYAGILLKSILHYSLQNITSMQVSFIYLSHNNIYQDLMPALELFFLVLLLFTMFTDYQCDEGIAQIGKRDRLGIFTVLTITLALIWTALYLSFTPVGNTIILGVQGRYYIPLIPLATALLNMRRMSGGMERRNYNLLVTYCNGTGLFAMLFILSVCNFWL